MTTFIAICRGNSLDDYQLLALSTDRNILQQFAWLLLGENCPETILSDNKFSDRKNTSKNLSEV